MINESSIEQSMLRELWVAHFLSHPQTLWYNLIIIVLIRDLNA